MVVTLLLLVFFAIGQLVNLMKSERHMRIKVGKDAASANNDAGEKDQRQQRTPLELDE